MSDPYLGEIRIVPFNFPPKGWAFCDGQLFPISQNNALFSIMGTTYGGDGSVTFALPDLRERCPIHPGAGPGLSQYALGDARGQESVVLTADQTTHTHTLMAVSDPATEVSPSSHALAQANSTLGNIYHAPTNPVAMNAGSVTSVGGSLPHENRAPYLAVHFIVAINGAYPAAVKEVVMSTPFLSEIKIFAGNVPPRGWAICNGQLLDIAQNQALFSLLGTIYGGDGIRTLALPDLRGRAPLHSGTQIALGTKGGVEAVALNVSELPAHSHTLVASSDAANTVSPAGKALATPPRRNLYDSSSDTTMTGQSLTATGGDEAHENRQPYIVLNYIISLQGIFPSRN